MSNAEKLYEKLKICPISDLLSACAVAETSGMDEKRKDFLYIILEERLLTRRMMKKLGMNEATK